MQPDQPNNYWQQPTEPTPEPEKPAEPTEMYTPTPETEPTPTPEPVPENTETPQTPVIEEPVHWSANEYIHEEKNWIWFVLFAVVIIAFIAVDIFFLKSYTFSALVVVMAIAVIIYSRRPPRTIDYTLSGDQGLYVGEKLYHFSEFKAFGLITDREHHSIMLIPTKRFAPGVSVYFPEEAGEKIVDILGARLPMEDLKLDVIDKIVRKLRL